MALMIAALGSFGIYVLAASGNIVADIYDRPLMMINFSRAASQVFTEMQEELLRYQTAGPEDKAAIDARMPRLEQNFLGDLDVAREHAFSDEDRAIIGSIRGQEATWNESWHRIGGAPARQRLETLSRQIGLSFDRLIASTTDKAFVKRSEALNAIREFRYASMTSATLAVLLAGFITFMLTRRIVRPLSAAAQIADRIADGALDTPIPKGGRDETGILLNSMQVMQDNIREMMAREQAQRQSAQTRLVDALESSREGMVLVDAAGHIVVANSQMGRFFPHIAPQFSEGATFAGIPPLIRDHLLRPGDCPDLTELSMHAGEFQLADGRWIRVSRSTTREQGAFFFFTDFTEIKEREWRYLEAQRQAEAASEAKSTFLANMSHELRTPLNAIIGFSEIMTKEAFGPIGNAHYASYTDDILQSGRHLLAIINGVLDLAKSQSGTLQIHRETVDLRDILEDCASMMRDQCARGALTLDFNPPPTPLFVPGQPAKLRQIALNLLSNAVKFTEPGGHIAIRAKATPPDLIVFEVADTGIGMTPEQIPVALSPFGQVDSRLSRRYEGTGLGLPLAKQLVELHDGRLTVESTPGVGTTVRVQLPAAIAEPVRLTSAAA